MPQLRTWTEQAKWLQMLRLTVDSDDDLERKTSFAAFEKQMAATEARWPHYFLVKVSKTPTLRSGLNRCELMCTQCF